MSEHLLERQRVLEEKANNAIGEAWAKANIALQQFSGERPVTEISLWQAAEAAEYACALYSLAHDLQDFDPPVKIDKKQDPSVLVKKSVEELKTVRGLQATPAKEVYSSLRVAADCLKVAYLEKTKRPSRRLSQSLTKP